MTGTTFGRTDPLDTPQKGGQLRLTLAVVLFESIAVAVLAAVLVAAVWGPRLSPPDPGSDVSAESVEDGRVAAARMARLTLFPAFALAYGVLGRRSRPPILRACGFAPAVRPIRSYAAGFLAAVLPLVLLIGLLLALGARTFEVRGGVGKLAWLFGRTVLLGILLVIAEEGLFRGVLLGDFVRALGVRAGVLACSLFFAVTHFLGVSDDWRRIPGGIRSGPDVVLALLQGMGRMFTEWPELVGLVLVGVILSILRLRAGHLYLAMGAHAGWYAVRQMDRYFVHEVDAVVAAHQIWLGTEQYLDGVFGWAALLLTFFVALNSRLARKPERRTEP